MQQAEPERGPLLAAGARVVPVPQIHTNTQGTGDRNGTVQTALLPTQLTHLQVYKVFGLNLRFWTVVISYKSGANQNPKRGGKKTWSRSEEKVDRLYRTAYSAFSVSERSEGKRRIYSNRKDRVKENSIFQQLFLLGAVSSVILGFFPLC